MKLLLPILLFAFCIACNNKPKLTMADLKFADYEREWIAKNKVDTAFSFPEFDGTLFVLGPQADTTHITIYNTEGDPVYIENPGFWSGFSKYEYNNLQFKTLATGGSCVITTTNIAYTFVADSNKLYQTETHLNNKRYTKTVVCQYLFDDTGRLIKQKEPSSNEACNYYYSANGKLRRILQCPESIDDDFVKRVKYFSKNEGLTNMHILTDTWIYYSTKGVPDSAITRSYNANTKLNFSVKKYYTANGLCAKKIEHDTIVTHYKYTFRK